MKCCDAPRIRQRKGGHMREQTHTVFDGLKKRLQHLRPQLLCAESTNNTLRALFFEVNRHHNSSLRLGLHTRARIVKFVHHNSAAKTLRSSWRSLRKKGKSDGLVRRSQLLRESEAGKESLEHSSEVNRPTCKRKSTRRSVCDQKCDL